MAEIFLARLWGQGGFFRDVVVKRLFPHFAAHTEVVAKFQYEARLLAELCHPNVPQVIDLYFEQGTWHIVMEYVDGYDVAHLWRAGMRAGKMMPLSVSLAIVMQACEALHHAHCRADHAGRALQIVHRDVTPQNIMVTRDGVVKLLDFGVAKTAARNSNENQGLTGTLSYMSPEQVRGEPLDRRSDVFSLGIILYELTTGTRLFRGNQVQIMTAIAESEIPNPSQRLRTYPEELQRIVSLALCRKRDDRMSSTSRLAFALEQFAQEHALGVGPRSVAQYVSHVLPMQPVAEEALGLVRESQQAEERHVEDRGQDRASDVHLAVDRGVTDAHPMLANGESEPEFDSEGHTTCSDYAREVDTTQVDSELSVMQRSVKTKT